jgi:hypothetical protein
MFEFLKKKEDKTKELKELFQKEVYKGIETSQQTQFTQVQPMQSIQQNTQIQQVQQNLQPQTSIQDRINILESKIENLRIYLEMINSKLDRLEALLRAKGLI